MQFQASPPSGRQPLLRPRLARTMRTNLRIQAGICNNQPLNRPAIADMRIKNLIHIGRRNASVPNRVRVNNHSRAMFTLIKTSGLIGPHPRLKPARRQPRLEQTMQRRLVPGIAAPSRVIRRTLVSADKDVFLEFGHSVESVAENNILRARQNTSHDCHPEVSALALALKDLCNSFPREDEAAFAKNNLRRSCKKIRFYRSSSRTVILK
jgi:hypothetical protein